MAKPYTQEDFIKLAKLKHGVSIDFSEFIYTKSTSYGKCKCNKCGHVWETRADVILRGCGCPSCSKGNHQRLSFEEVQKRINNITLNKETYVDTKHSCEATCLKCGHTWFPRINDLLNGHGCPQCAIKSFKHTQEDAKELLLDKYKDVFNFDKFQYTGCHNKCTLICKKCEREITQSFNRFLTVNVKCTCHDDYRRSANELKVRDILNNNQIKFLTNDRKILSGLELDFYLPLLNIGIECQGEQHFIMKTFGGKDEEKNLKRFAEQQERDNRKKQLCQEKGIELIYFLDKEYNSFMTETDIYFNKFENLLNYIKNKSNGNTFQRNC